MSNISTFKVDCQKDICEQLEHTGLRQARRSLVLMPQHLRWECIAPERQGSQRNDLQVSFHLPAGGYATSVLREAFTLVEGAGDGL